MQEKEFVHALCIMVQWWGASLGRNRYTLKHATTAQLLLRVVKHTRVRFVWVWPMCIRSSRGKKTWSVKKVLLWLQNGRLAEINTLLLAELSWHLSTSDPLQTVCDHILELYNSRIPTVGRNGCLAEIDMRAAARVVLILVCFQSPPCVCDFTRIFNTDGNSFLKLRAKSDRNGDKHFLPYLRALEVIFLQLH